MTVQVPLCVHQCYKVATQRASPDYTAIKQCAGEQVDLKPEEGCYHNFWWVQLDTPIGRGWVSAVFISTGDNQQPVPDVPKAATVNT